MQDLVVAGRRAVNMLPVDETIERLANDQTPELETD